jgi:hypothetical protein
MTDNKLKRKRNTDLKYYYRKKLRESGIEYDSNMELEALKNIYYTLVKLPKKRDKPIMKKTTTKDHISDQFYTTVDEIEKEAEAENIHMRNNLQEGISPLIKDRGGEDIPLSVINNPRINLDQYHSNIRKREKEKKSKSTWRI